MPPWSGKEASSPSVGRGCCCLLGPWVSKEGPVTTLQNGGEGEVGKAVGPATPWVLLRGPCGVLLV